MTTLASASNWRRRKLSVPPFLVDELRVRLSGRPRGLRVHNRGRAPPPTQHFRRRYWLPAVAEAGLALLRFHGPPPYVREFLLIAQAAHAKDIQIRLDHASIGTTMNVYGHLLPSLDERLAAGRDEAYRKGKGAR